MFGGYVSGLTEWGMYVGIDPTKIEGMVALRDIKSDFFEFDQEKYRIVGRRTGVIYNLGDRVKIRVKAADIEQKLLDYELVETGFEKRVEKGPADDADTAKGNKAARKAKVKAAIRLSKQRKTTRRK